MMFARFPPAEKMVRFSAFKEVGLGRQVEIFIETVRLETDKSSLM